MLLITSVVASAQSWVWRLATTVRALGIVLETVPLTVLYRVGCRAAAPFGIALQGWCRFDACSADPLATGLLHEPVCC